MSKKKLKKKIKSLIAENKKLKSTLSFVLLKIISEDSLPS